MMSAAEKKVLRGEIRQRIARLPRDVRTAGDSAVCRHLQQLARELGVGVILGYLALGDEVRIDGFLASAIEDGREVLLPSASDGQLGFRRWTPSVRLERDGEGVLAPAGADRAGFGDGPSFLMVVPGRAFDGSGGRLGRGGGYYDRVLAALPAASGRVVGVAWDCQVVDAVPMESHDARVHGVVTPLGYSPAR